jgi:sulfide:quinone oxidoreductase
MDVDPERQVIRSYNDEKIDYDLLVSVPTNMGAEVIRRSGMGDELGFVPTDPHTLQAKGWENVWVIGDAGATTAPKVGSTAHAMLRILAGNLQKVDQGLPPAAEFDGRTTCMIETGYKKGVLLSFSYDTEPMPGKFPFPRIGPFTILKETYSNYLGKAAFHHLYWGGLLKRGRIPFEPYFFVNEKEYNC